MDKALFEKLRDVRKAIATASHIAPYMVFSDKSLQAMATEKPTTQAEFSIIYGVGELKCQKYWRPFTAAIRDHFQDHTNDARQVEEDEDNGNGRDISHAEDKIWLHRALEAPAVGQLVMNDLAVHDPSHIDSREQATQQHEDIAGSIIHHVEDVLAPQLNVIQHIE